MSGRSIAEMFGLDGRVAAITGGGGVLCGTMARALGALGVKVAVMDIREEAAAAVADDITAAGGEAAGVKCDVLDKASVQEAYDAVVARFGGVDILVNGAGGNHPKATTSDEIRSP